MKDLNKVYKSVTKEVAEDESLKLEEKWGAKYPVVIESWQRNWEQLSRLFSVLFPRIFPERQYGPFIDARSSMACLKFY